MTGLEIADANNHFVAAVEGELPTESDAANAAFIVRACNSHDEPLAALYALIEELDYDAVKDHEHEGCTYCEGCSRCSYCEAVAAIAKAEGRG